MSAALLRPPAPASPAGLATASTRSAASPPLPHVVPRAYAGPQGGGVAPAVGVPPPDARTVPARPPPPPPPPLSYKVSLFGAFRGRALVRDVAVWRVGARFLVLRMRWPATARRRGATATTLTAPPSLTPASARRLPHTQPEIFKFAGPAPETINGRLAMAFLPLAAATEASTGASLSSLGSALLHPPLSPSVAASAAAAGLIVLASLIPMRVGAVAEAFGPFTPGRERAAGRAAMLGFAALLLLEGRAGGVPFF
jgi:hypothetical protein